MAKQSRKSRARPARAAKAVAPAPRAELNVSENDQRIAREAMQKQQRGGRLSQIEERAIARVRKERERLDRWRYYRSIPKGHWREMSGRQDKILNEQAGRYGIPIAGPVIDLPGVVNWLHQFLADNAAAIAAGKAEDPLMTGDSPALERYRLATAKIKELELAEKLRNVIKREEVHTRLTRVSAAQKAFREKLERRFGREAVDWFDQAVDVMDQEAEQLAK